MYSGDVPSTSGLHSSQSSFYPHTAAPHHAQGPSTSRDAAPPPSSVPRTAEDSRHSASPQYMEMTPVRVANGGMEGGGREQLPMDETQRREEKEGNRKNGEGVKKIPMVHRPFKTVKSYETYNVYKKIQDFWPDQMRRVERLTVKELREASRNQALPLARVKKIMKIDENVQKQMIAADAPLLLSVASEMFIEELTLRSWEVTEEVKRKTLQKQDVATASTRHDHMDFLIDIIPRTNIQPRPKEMPKMGGMAVGMGQGAGGGGQPQMVQFMRDGSSMSQMMMKGASIINDVGPSTSNQQEFSARLESGEEAQVIQIGKPIPLSQQTISQLGLGPPLAPPTVHHPPQPSYPSHPSHSSHQPHHPAHPPPSSHQSHAPPSSHPTTSSSQLSTSSPHTQTTVRIPSHVMQNAASSYRGMREMRGRRGGMMRPMPPPHLSSQPGPSQSKN